MQGAAPYCNAADECLSPARGLSVLAFYILRSGIDRVFEIEI